VDRRLFLGGLVLGAFILTLAFFFWREGVQQPATSAATAPGTVPRLEPAAAPRPPTPVTAPAPADPSAATPVSTPDADEADTAGRRDRTSRHGARSR